jgi:hypothetical protein
MSEITQTSSVSSHFHSLLFVKERQMLRYQIGQGARFCQDVVLKSIDVISSFPISKIIQTVKDLCKASFSFAECLFSRHVDIVEASPKIVISKTKLKKSQ